MDQKYIATIIGLIFSAACFFATFTFAIPVFILLPVSGALEGMLTKVMGDTSYSAIGTAMIFVLLAFFLFTSLTYYLSLRYQIIKKQCFNKNHLLLFFGINLFIIHPLFFYLYASRDWSFARDGQFVFGAIETFPVSSLVFFFLGWSIDAMKNKMMQNMVID